MKRKGEGCHEGRSVLEGAGTRLERTSKPFRKRLHIVCHLRFVSASTLDAVVFDPSLMYAIDVRELEREDHDSNGLEESRERNCRHRRHIVRAMRHAGGMRHGKIQGM